MKKLFVLFVVFLFPFQWGCNNATPLPTINIPVASIPMGNYIIGTVIGSVWDYGSLPVTSISGATATLAVNRAAETTALVVLVTPGGPVTLPYFMSINYGTYSMATYETFGGAWTYTPGGSYSMSVSSSLGTTSATMTAPGGITWSALGSSVTATAAFAGTYDSASVQRSSPTPGITYNSMTANVGSPFPYPTSAFASTPTSPATFLASYSAAVTQYSFGSAASGSAFIWIQTYGKQFTR